MDGKAGIKVWEYETSVGVSEEMSRRKSKKGVREEWKEWRMRSKGMVRIVSWREWEETKDRRSSGFWKKEEGRVVVNEQ